MSIVDFSAIATISQNLTFCPKFYSNPQYFAEKIIFSTKKPLKCVLSLKENTQWIATSQLRELKAKLS